MKTTPLILAASKRLYSGMAVLWGLLIGVFGFLDWLLYGEAKKGSGPMLLYCILFLLASVGLIFSVCAFLNALACLAERKAIRLDDREIRAYNLPPMKLEDIESMTLLPEKSVHKKTLQIKSRNGQTIRIKQRFLNVPVQVLQEAIRLRKEN